MTAEGVSVRLESINVAHRAYRVRLNALEELRSIAALVRVVAPRPKPPQRAARRKTR